MPTPNQELTEMVCAALAEAGIASEKEVASLKARILAGKVKSEDWYLAVENSLKQASGAENDGN